MRLLCAVVVGRRRGSWRGCVGALFLHDRAIVDNECPSDRTQGAFDLIDVGPVLGVHNAVHGRIAHT